MAGGRGCAWQECAWKWAGVVGGMQCRRGVHGRGCLRKEESMWSMCGQCGGGTHATGMHSCVM